MKNKRLSFCRINLFFLLSLTLLFVCKSSFAQVIEENDPNIESGSRNSTKAEFLRNPYKVEAADQIKKPSFTGSQTKIQPSESNKLIEAYKLKLDHKSTNINNSSPYRPTNARTSEYEITKTIPQSNPKETFHWKPALIESGIFLGIQHAIRLTQDKTQSELHGKFFADWGNSVKAMKGWGDGDSAFTNYVAHPLQGGVTGRIFVNNSDKAKKQEFGSRKSYWTSRMKALAWSAAFSTQFEIGPISEATIGNVGLRMKKGRSTMAWVDMVVTPTIGTGVVIGEDMIDKYILKNWLEKRAGKATLSIKLFRCIFTPTNTFSNVLRWKYPWRRDNRLN